MVNYAVMRLIGKEKPDVILGGDGNDQYFGTSGREVALHYLISRYGMKPIVNFYIRFWIGLLLIQMQVLTGSVSTWIRYCIFWREICLAFLRFGWKNCLETILFFILLHIRFLICVVLSIYIPSITIRLM